jgi:glutamate synthase domain-containing protein 3
MKGDTRIEIVGGAGHGLGFEASGGEIVVEQETKK